MINSARVMVDGIGNWVVCHEIDRSKPAVIGRGSDCDIQLKNLNVSSRHAEIVHQDGAFHLRDLGSRNATYVNGKKVDGQQKLKAGDIIQIQPFSLRYQDDSGLRPDQTLSGTSLEELLTRRREAAEPAPVGLRVPQERGDRLPGADSGPAVTPPPVPEKSDQVGKEAKGEELQNTRRQSRRLANQVKLLRTAVLASREQECLVSMLQFCMKALNAEVAFLMLINPSTKKWEVRAQSKNFEDVARDRDKGDASPISLTLVTEAVKARKTMLTEDLPQQKREESRSMLVHSIESGIAAPIFESEKVVGCLYVDRREDLTDLFDQEDAADTTAYAECFADACQHFVLRRTMAAES